MNIPPRWSTSISELVQISSCIESKSLVQMSDICWDKDYLIVVNFKAFHYKYQDIHNQMVIRRHCKLMKIKGFRWPPWGEAANCTDIPSSRPEKKQTTSIHESVIHFVTQC